MHNSISSTNISKYFRFAKELALYQNDNYVGSNENALIYIMDTAHKTIEIGEETRRSSYKCGSRFSLNGPDPLSPLENHKLYGFL